MGFGDLICSSFKAKTQENLFVMNVIELKIKEYPIARIPFSLLKVCVFFIL